jgi:hypothetical protein
MGPSSVSSQQTRTSGLEGRVVPHYDYGMTVIFEEISEPRPDGRFIIEKLY